MLDPYAGGSDDPDVRLANWSVYLKTLFHAYTYLVEGQGEEGLESAYDGLDLAGWHTGGVNAEQAIERLCNLAFEGVEIRYHEGWIYAPDGRKKGISADYQLRFRDPSLKGRDITVLGFFVHGRLIDSTAAVVIVPDPDSDMGIMSHAEKVFGRDVLEWIAGNIDVER